MPLAERAGVACAQLPANPESDLRGYRVYRSEGEQGAAPEFLLTGSPITATTYVDAIAQGVQTRYHYRVVAVNTTQVDSAPSVAVTAGLLDRTPPPTPLLVSVTATPAGLTLSWTQADVPDLSEFEVTRTAAGHPVTVVGTPDAAARMFTDPTAAPGVVYSYSLTSVDRTGNRSQSAVPIAASRPAPAGSPPPCAQRSCRTTRACASAGPPAPVQPDTWCSA